MILATNLELKSYAFDIISITVSRIRKVTRVRVTKLSLAPEELPFGLFTYIHLAGSKHGYSQELPSSDPANSFL